jgi:hypothetical protein
MKTHQTGNPSKTSPRRFPFRVRSFLAVWAVSGLVPGGTNWTGFEFGVIHYMCSF